MKAVFDDLAQKYDTDFTESAIGKLQRNQVWNFLENRILPKGKSKILEVNCGTGVDAIWLSNKGNEVLATDISIKMIEIASSKIHPENLRFQQAGFHNLSDIAAKGSLDFIFSDFGGLNCISPNEFKKFLSDSYVILKPGGSLVLVVMPKFCVWESLYYLFKKPSIAFRRLQKKAKAVGFQSSLDVYYYNPSDLKKLGNGKFKTKFNAPVGFFLPPSYLEGFFSKKPALLTLLNRLEKLTGDLSFLSRFSDHFIIQLAKTK